MANEYSLKINQTHYLLKRLVHSDLPLTYHIHFYCSYQNIILRMGLINGTWSFLNKQKIHSNLALLEHDLASEIVTNEQRIQDFEDNGNFTFSP